MPLFPILLEPEDLAKQLPLASNAVIIEQSSLEDYNAGHIPNSFWLDFKELQGQPLAGELPSTEQLAAIFNRFGINNDTHIICSDGEGGGWAGRLIWILDSIGHKNYSLLNGGLIAWRAENYPLSQSAPELPVASQYSVTHSNTTTQWAKEKILAHLQDDTVVIWDARSYPEYTGEKANSARGGHIPGALHYEWTSAMDQSRHLRLKSLEQIKAELADLGITEKHTIVTHCQSHHRSGLTYVIGKLLGLNIVAYAGSWSEWGNLDSSPINTGSQP